MFVKDANISGFLGIMKSQGFALNAKVLIGIERKMYPREKEFSKLLDKQGRKWIYEPKRFNLNNTTYCPDFYIPKEKLYIEVVGSRQAYHLNKKKIAKFRRLFPKIKLLVMEWKGKKYPIAQTFFSRWQGDMEELHNFKLGLGKIL